MSNAVKKFNGLNGSIIDTQTLESLLKLANSEGQQYLENRIKKAIEAAKAAGINEFKTGGNVIEQVPQNSLPGIDVVPSYIGESEISGLNKAVSPDDIYQYITDMMINTIKEVGHLPWQRNWDKTITLWDGGQAVNFESKKPYRGVNYWMVNFKPEKKGDKWVLVERDLTNPYFLTLNQIKKNKGKIKKGAQATRVVYFTKLYTHTQQNENGNNLTISTYNKAKFLAWIKKYQKQLRALKNMSIERLANSYIPILKYYNVFHGADVTGIEWPKAVKNTNYTKTEKQRYEVAERVIELMPKKPEIIYGGNQPAYYPSYDHVRMTPITAFKDENTYYSTLFHELVHSTGHPNRLNRSTMSVYIKPSKTDYAKEELVAEMGAVFLCAETGILFSVIENSAKYLAGWSRRIVKNMEDDNRFFFRASSKAQEAADFILDKNKEGAPAYFYKKNTSLTTKKKDTRAPKKNTVVVSKFKNGDVVTLLKQWGNVKPGDIGKISERKERKASNGEPMHRVIFNGKVGVFPAKIITTVKPQPNRKPKRENKDPQQLALLGAAKSKNRSKKQKIVPKIKKTVPKKKQNGLKAVETEPINTATGKEVSGGTSRAAVSVPPSKRGNILTASEVGAMEFEILQLDEGWENLFQTPAKNMNMAVWAGPKNGKTVSCLQIASYFTKFGPTLYNFADQGISLSTKKLIKLSGLDQKQNAYVTTSVTLEDLHQDIQQVNPQFVFIDMINQFIDSTGIKAHEFKDQFLRRYPDTSFILVFEVTKDGNFKGDQAWTHVVDQLLTLDNYIMDSKGRYGTGERIMWDEGAKKYNPKRYAQIMEDLKQENESSIDTKTEATPKTSVPDLKYNFETV
ncbi:ArdC family protein [Cochleicola gelatinilyticus]|uniref:DNA primase n=1 Tax=Cochleicola gelatinilyticus TaxID=1763537 RepID=A0A167IKT0_9FLAO|nr:zincin-like metallopeptidase domain-containing protein [Cochleicola gelatinilyticus]OAB79756.1 hypothetical protein ULVI_03145 [Cochleicola gelatinilyticus]